MTERPDSTARILPSPSSQTSVVLQKCSFSDAQAARKYPRGRRGAVLGDLPGNAVAGTIPRVRGADWRGDTARTKAPGSAPRPRAATVRSRGSFVLGAAGDHHAGSRRSMAVDARKVPARQPGCRHPARHLKWPRSVHMRGAGALIGAGPAWRNPCANTGLPPTVLVLVAPSGRTPSPHGLGRVTTVHRHVRPSQRRRGTL